MERRLVLRSVLAFHLATAVVHGSTHALVPVSLPAWQNVLVLVAVIVGPIAGLVMTERGASIGLPVFTLSLAGALLIGLVLHFVVENPDHVHSIPPNQWQLAFQLSAMGVAIVPAVGTVIGWWYWKLNRPP